ncbi:MAG: sigma-E factor negative regulatory protein [Polaromonas sp.]|uniref:sigma-E factor negative regulatory protein n=1 Tax=Polaromonas sp. TaxID=1869339 RepID=UPI002730868B|nr:sigma-E factor negative regulatory protein [Polaromonas sp.]MDP2257811.1 sigma-E factor negative regulatory protein [Polaromonas sp.]MDP3708689.1 sigma-E factor negative regulatory protein [Polaromonas sp.]
MKPSMQTSELLSALADGQLVGEDFAAALQACQQDESALARWGSYHLIGDVLRLPAHVPAPLLHGMDLAFVDRLNQRLVLESLAGVALPDSDSAVSTQGAVTGELAHHRGPASNDGNFRWKLVAGFASLAAVSAIAWNASGLLAPPAAAPQLAQAGGAQQVMVASPQGLMVRDARLEELLAAHAQLSGTSALQVPSGFLRNATFETPQNAGR